MTPDIGYLILDILNLISDTWYLILQSKTVISPPSKLHIKSKNFFYKSFLVFSKWISDKKKRKHNTSLDTCNLKHACKLDTIDTCFLLHITCYLILNICYIFLSCKKLIQIGESWESSWRLKIDIGENSVCCTKVTES